MSSTNLLGNTITVLALVGLIGSATATKSGHTYTYSHNDNDYTHTLSNVLQCDKCSHKICSAEDVFYTRSELSLSRRNHTYSDSVTRINKTTLIQLFVNPAGYSFEVITTKKSEVQVHGEPSAHASWFPGYSWQTVTCKLCGEHLGWKFTVSDDFDVQDKEQLQFYGLIFSKLKALKGAVKSEQAYHQEL